MQKREQLVEEYYSAVQKYSEAVSRLRQLKGPEFEHAYSEVESLRQQSEQCRAALEKSNTNP
ncbi:MAG TPA: hypothetical protein VKX49_09275 [Bryobacteraceae bacterium]|nr:hypothetical protein [Bryobacteraceae bacterium]